MDNSFKNLIQESSVLLVVVPVKASFDQVAAALSLYLSFSEQKDVSVVSPNPVTVEYNRLVGVNKISQDVGNKNLIIRFSDYEAGNIEKVSYDIENRQFQLTVIPKPGFNAPKKNQIKINYSGFSSDLIILVGGSSQEDFPVLNQKDAEKAKILHIGTKDLNAQNRKIISLSRPASSICEIVGMYLKNSGFEINADVATNLLMGIEAASNIYASRETTAETLALASELMKLGGKRLQQNMPPHGHYPPGSIPGQFSSHFPQAAVKPKDSAQEGTAEVKEKDKLFEKPIEKVVSNNSQPESQVPNNWLKKPKIYKGTSVD